MASFLTKIFGSRNDRLIKQYRRKVAAINKLEPEMKALSDEQLKAKTAEFRQRLADGASLDSLLPEAFAVVREARLPVPPGRVNAPIESSLRQCASERRLGRLLPRHFG